MQSRSALVLCTRCNNLQLVVREIRTDINMLVKDDRPDQWNAKTGNVKILISSLECTPSTLVLQLQMENVHIVRMKPSDP